VAHGTEAIEPGRWSQARLPRRLLVLILAVAAVALGGVYYVASAARTPQSGTATAAQVRLPGANALVLTGPADAVAVAVAHQLFASAPVVVLAAAGQPASVAAAARDARRWSAPLLLTSAVPRATGAAMLSAAAQAEITGLHPRAVLAVGVTARAVAARLPGINVVTSTASLPATIAPRPMRQVALLVDSGRPGAAAMAAIATARAAGAEVIAVRDGDPRADPAAIAVLAASRPRHVLAVGAGFGPAGAVAANVAVAETGVQLPGGGQILFPGHRLIALYGNPGTPALGALGQQGLGASIARVSGLAARYRTLSSVAVVPTFEIIATVAQASAGPGGLFSFQTPVASLRRWVNGAVAAGLYVVLDLQPGRANLLAQAKLYQSLLKLPDVGLALDPEWKLQPGQLPLRQIGSVSIAEINSVITWLARLTARYHLPQKLLVLHQFRLSMIQDEARLDTHNADLAIVIHMDGQGTPGAKLQTWDAVTAAAPLRVFLGWKNFFVKDHPMMMPRETMHRTPQPVMISYQ
jgi:hypothetical protein